MKFLNLLLFGILMLSSCLPRYYLCETTSDIPLYDIASRFGDTLVTIPKGTKVMVQGKSSSLHRKVKYEDIVGWGYKLSFKSEEPYKYKGFLTITKKTNYSSGGGNVNVKGYYRKDGTYVKPHTRSSPKKH